MVSLRDTNTHTHTQTLNSVNKFSVQTFVVTLFKFPSKPKILSIDIFSQTLNLKVQIRKQKQNTKPEKSRNGIFELKFKLNEEAEDK